MRRPQRPTHKSPAERAPAPSVEATRLRARKPASDAAFDASLLAFLDGCMRTPVRRATARRISFGTDDIRLELSVCSIVCHTYIEWLSVDGRRRLIEADHREGSAKHGALLHLLGAPAIGARLLPEGLQIDIEGGGTLHFARLESGISFEIHTPEFGPALY